MFADQVGLSVGSRFAGRVYPRASYPTGEKLGMKWTAVPSEEGEQPTSLSRFDALHSQMYYKPWVLIGNAVLTISPGRFTFVGLRLIYMQVAVFEGKNPMNEIFLHPFVIA